MPRARIEPSKRTSVQEEEAKLRDVEYSAVHMATWSRNNVPTKHGRPIWGQEGETLITCHLEAGFHEQG